MKSNSPRAQALVPSIKSRSETKPFKITDCRKRGQFEGSYFGKLGVHPLPPWSIGIIELDGSLHVNLLFQDAYLPKY